MRVSIPVLLEAAYASWSVQDLDATMDCFADDVLFATHLPADVVPYAGMSHGKVELRRQLQMIIDRFDFLEYRPVQISTQGRSFHSQVNMHYRHRTTGLTYEGRLRHIWRIEGDEITHFEEFHDPDRVRAFFQLLANYESRMPDGLGGPRRS